VDLKKLTKVEGNKICADCPERMPGYANLTHNTFVCTKCSGILREIQCKIKGISMSTFTAEDVEALAQGGNARHNEVYLRKLNPSQYTLPNGQDQSKMREFIKFKYTEKRWMDRGGDDFGGGGGRGGGGGGGGGGAWGDSSDQSKRTSFGAQQAQAPSFAPSPVSH